MPAVDPSMCGSAWSPSAPFLGALRKLVSGTTFAAQLDFVACTATDPFCGYGTALVKKWFGRVEEYWKLADDLLSSGALESCHECKIIVLRDLGWSRIISGASTRAKGKEQLLLSCRTLLSQGGPGRLFGHASPCRLAMELPELTQEDRTKVSGVEALRATCDVDWQGSRSDDKTWIYLSGIWW